MAHPTVEELQAGLDVIRAAPKDRGVLELIVRRPAVGLREVLETGELSLTEGLVGDTWKDRGSNRSADGRRHPDMQLNVMSSRAAALVAGARSRWPLAGDQLYVDLDLSTTNLPPGARLSIGAAIIEVTDQPHTGCAKFVERFGLESMKFVNAPVGRELQLRGINAKVIQPGVIRTGDAVMRLV